MITEPLSAVRFAYGGLDPESYTVVQQLTRDIKSLSRRTPQDDIDLGQKLTEVKARFAPGHFGTWLAAEFAWGRETAIDLMQVARTFKSVNFADLQIRTSALHALAAPSTPQSARNEAIARAQAGEAITCNTARAIIERHRKPLPEGYVAPNSGETG